jgi:glutamine amidotransferase-like uncharacterized protein
VEGVDMTSAALMSYRAVFEDDPQPVAAAGLGSAPQPAGTLHPLGTLDANDVPRKRSLLIASIALIAFAAPGCKHANESEVPLTRIPVTPILLFNGTGTSSNDVAAVESILNEQNLKYSTADSKQLNEMSESRFRTYRLLIIPGGNYIAIGKGLLPSTTAKIHDAVQNGLNYLGICAGGLIAGDSKYNSLNLTSGVRFDFYSAVNRGIHKAAVAIPGNGAPTLDQYWEDGPQFTGWGDVVGKYPDGTPAVVEGKSGDGWVILSGVHPEAPASWRRGMNFRTPVNDDNEYAAALIRAALNGTRLPHYRDRTPEQERRKGA